MPSGDVRQLSSTWRFLVLTLGEHQTKSKNVRSDHKMPRMTQGDIAKYDREQKDASSPVLAQRSNLHGTVHLMRRFLAPDSNGEYAIGSVAGALGGYYRG